MCKRIEPVQKHICTQLQYFCFFYVQFGYSIKREKRKIIFHFFLWPFVFTAEASSPSNNVFFVIFLARGAALIENKTVNKL